MKGLYKTISVGLMSLPLVLGGCAEMSSEQPYIKVRGTVISETYVPRSTGSFQHPVIDSKYSFSMKTENGKKVVQVQSARGSLRNISKETIASLVDPDTKVEIEIKEGYMNNQVYFVSADKIKALE